MTTVQQKNPSQLLYISLAFGFSLAVNAWVFFRISGGLFNPAVSGYTAASLFAGIIVAPYLDSVTDSICHHIGNNRHGPHRRHNLGPRGPPLRNPNRGGDSRSLHRPSTLPRRSRSQHDSRRRNYNRARCDHRDDTYGAAGIHDLHAGGGEACREFYCAGGDWIEFVYR